MAEKQRPKMITGYNHNVKHKGRIYHVQTEDSGIDNPHIITHLFMGGNILATKKTSYADIVTAENLEEIVRELMQEQHKAMLRNLVNGVYDDIEIPGEAVPPPAPEAAAVSPATAKPGATPPPAVPLTTPSPPPPQLKPIPQPQPSVVKPPEPVQPPAAPSAKFPPPRPATGQPRQIPLQRLPTQPVISAVSPTVAIDTVPPRPVARPLQVTVQAKPPPLPPKVLPPEVLAARQLTEKPKLQKAPGPTIFGEDLISEKSLDEVILSYLAGEEKEK